VQGYIRFGGRGGPPGPPLAASLDSEILMLQTKFSELKVPIPTRVSEKTFDLKNFRLKPLA